MRDEPDPPRKFYRLKPREFDAVNAPVGTAPADSTPTDVRGHLQAANAGTTPRPAKPATPAPEPTNDIHALLRDKVARDTAAGTNDLAPLHRRRSRRTRDYWLVLLTVNAFFAFAAFGPFQNPMTLIYGISGMILFSIGLTWVMWFVMDDY